MALTVDNMKNQLRIDGTADDAYLAELLAEAQEYIIDAVDPDLPVETYETHKIFDRAVAMLVAGWYFNRQAVAPAQQYPVPYGVESIIDKLRGALWTTDAGDDTHGTD